MVKGILEYWMAYTIQYSMVEGILVYWMGYTLQYSMVEGILVYWMGYTLILYSKVWYKGIQVYWILIV